MNNITDSTITLYQLPGCPFCAKARAALDENNITYTTVDVQRDREDETRKMIAEKSGVPTTPVLNVGDEWIGDSGNIVAWANEHKK